MQQDERAVDIAMVPGTFDPITVGHIDVVRRAAKLFDEVIVAVAESPRKNGAGRMFTMQQRMELAQQALSDIPNVRVASFTGLLVDFAAQNGVKALVKGLRAVTDFESEFQQAALNYKLDPSLETIFIMSAPENMYLSSSVVREIAYCKGNVHGLVPPVVGKALSQMTGCDY